MPQLSDHSTYGTVPVCGMSVLIAHPLHPHVTEPSGIGMDWQVLGPPGFAGVQPLGRAGSHIRYIVALKERCHSPYIDASCVNGLSVAVSFARVVV